MLHARAEEAGGRRRGAGGRAHAVAGREGRDGLHGPPPPGRARRAGVRARDGLHDRGGPEHGGIAAFVARVASARGPRALA